MCKSVPLNDTVPFIANFVLFYYSLQVVVAALAVTCSADLLAPRQQAPQNAFSAGGGDFLGAARNTPTHYIPPNNQYLPPQPPSRPTNTYIPPNPATPKPVYLPPPAPSRPTNVYLPPQPNPKPVYIPPLSKPTGGYLPPTQMPGNAYLPPSGKPVTPPVPILKQINELHEDGSFNYE